jgi:hypothetical protein
LTVADLPNTLSTFNVLKAGAVLSRFHFIDFLQEFQITEAPKKHIKKRNFFIYKIDCWGNLKSPSYGIYKR